MFKNMDNKDDRLVTKQVGQIITEACMLRLQLYLKMCHNLTEKKVKIAFENLTPAEIISRTKGRFV